MNILQQLGLDADSFTWHDLALCKNLDNPDNFFEDYEKRESIAKAIDDMCLSCPVMQQCALYAQEAKESGVWGGVYWNGSGAPDKNRNSHKTEEVWNQIKTRLAA